ncbi:MAG: hypothetical protein ACRD0P_06390 [Stackebrandtia sp.]
MSTDTRNVTTDLLRSQGWTVAIFWGLMYTVFLTAGIIVHLTAGLHDSVWAGARWWPQYFIFAHGVMTTAVYLRIFVSHGVTRRAFILGGTGFGLAIAVASGVAIQLGFVVERGVLNSVGGTQTTYMEDLASSPLRMLTSAFEFSALYAAYFFAGWLIATVFYRRGVVGGLLVIVPSVVPALVLEVTQWGVGPLADVASGWRIGESVSPVLLGLGLVFVAALIFTGRRQLVDVSISSK